MNEERIRAKAQELIKTQGIDPHVALRIAQDIEKSTDIEFGETKAKLEKLKKQKNTLVVGVVIVSLFTVFFGASFFLESINPHKKVRWVLISEIDDNNVSENLVRMKIPGTSEDAILSVACESNENSKSKPGPRLEASEFLAVPEGSSVDTRPTKFKVKQNKDGRTISVEYFDEKNKKNVVGEFEIQEESALDQDYTDNVLFSAITDDEQDAIPVDFVIIKNKDGNTISLSAKPMNKEDGKTKEFEFRIKDKE